MVFITKKENGKKTQKTKNQPNKEKPEQKHNCGVVEAWAVCSLQGPDVGVGAG